MLVSSPASAWESASVQVYQRSGAGGQCRPLLLCQSVLSDSQLRFHDVDSQAAGSRRLSPIRRVAIRPPTARPLSSNTTAHPLACSTPAAVKPVIQVSAQNSAQTGLGGELCACFVTNAPLAK